MRKITLILMGIAIIAGCGEEKPTDNNEPGIVVTITPFRVVVNFGTIYQFRAAVEGTDNEIVTWFANDVAGGDSTYGRIDSAGYYAAPEIEPPDADSVRIEARSAVDPTKSGFAWAVLIDPSKIYVSFLGSDSLGIGSLHRPYRTISKALTRAVMGQIIHVSSGEFDVAAGESFPLAIPPGVTVKGAGADSTFVTGPGGMNPLTDAMFEVHGDAITIEAMHIRSSDSLGVGVWLRPGIQTRLVRNRITRNYIAIYVDGPGGTGVPRPIIDANQIDLDSIGIVTADSSQPIIRNSVITECYKFGIDIRDFSRPDLGDNDSTGAGMNTIRDCGDFNYHWLIFNGTSNTIMAIGNSWQVPLPANNDQFIYDDEESGNSSGPVILE
jgi:hypothetical protein